MYKFYILPSTNEQFYVRFNYNSEPMVWSETLTTKASAQNNIESIKANAPCADIVDLTAGETGSGYRWEIDCSKMQKLLMKLHQKLLNSNAPALVLGFSFIKDKKMPKRAKTRVRSTITGQFLPKRMAKRWPRTTVTERVGGKPTGGVGRSAITGKFVKKSVVRRSPWTTMRDG